MMNNVERINYMKCLLVSRFNVSNIGDLVISHKLRDIISEYGTVHKYNLFGSPYNFKDINKIEFSSYSIKYKIVNSIENSKAKEILSIYLKIKKKITRPSRASNNRYENIINDFDLIVIGGGNMLMSLTDSYKNIENFERYVDIAVMNQKPVFVMDIGIGPFKNRSQLMKSIKTLNKCDKITFRDKQSYDLYIDNGGDREKSFISLDPVFLFTQETPTTSLTKKNTSIGLNIIDSRLLGETIEEYDKKISSYVELAEALLEYPNIELQLFITSKEDQSALDDVYNKLKKHPKVKKVKVNGLKNLIDLYNEIDVLIGTRMHSMIIAYTMHVSLIGLSWQPKVDAFFSIVDEKAFLFNFEEMHKNINEIKNATVERLKNREIDKRKTEKKLEVIKRKSDIDREILNDYKKRYKN